MNFRQDDLADLDVEYTCRACGRLEGDCSAEPCDAVRYDRIAFYVPPAPRVRLSTLALIAIAATALSVAVSFMAGYSYAMASGPAIIAHGCEGAGGDLWASDASDFPTSCAAIEESE